MYVQEFYLFRMTPAILTIIKAGFSQKAKLLRLLCRFSGILILSIGGDILLFRFRDSIGVDLSKIVFHLQGQPRRWGQGRSVSGPRLWRKVY